MYTSYLNTFSSDCLILFQSSVVESGQDSSQEVHHQVDFDIENQHHIRNRL